MKILTVQQIRDIDQRAIKEFGVSSIALMQRAGEGIAEAVAEILVERNLPGVVGIITGKGNNGGDGFSAALSLATRGIKSRIFALFSHGELSKDAGTFYRKAKSHKSIKILNVSTVPLLRKHEASVQRCSVLVDAILGTGFHGKPKGVVEEAIDLINAFRGVVVAIDVPSGLDASTGQAEKAVMADLTLTMGFCKAGFLQGDAMNYVGALRIIDIGIPPLLGDGARSDFHLLDRSMVGAVLPRRARISHKGTYGHVLIVGGSLGMTGAAILCARAALRAGSGLVSVACPASAQMAVAAGCTEAMTVALPDSLDVVVLRDVVASRKFDALVLGPGIGRDPNTQKFVIRTLLEIDAPMVLDADALYSIAANKFDLLKAKSQKLILTPHLGEFARLIGKDVEKVKMSLWGDISILSVNSGAIVVVKSHVCAISNGKSGVLINISGNPGMATAGMGDVLSGIIGSFLGQGLSPLDAAAAGVYIHSSAGDLAAKCCGFYGLIASDVIETIPQAILEIPLRR